MAFSFLVADARDHRQEGETARESHREGRQSHGHDRRPHGDRGRRRLVVSEEVRGDDKDGDRSEQCRHDEQSKQAKGVEEQEPCLSTQQMPVHDVPVESEGLACHRHRGGACMNLSIPDAVPSQLDGEQEDNHGMGVDGRVSVDELR